MKVEIWSDVMCPFCYIGKRRFEHALQELPYAKDIKVEWKSFQLDPSIKSNQGKTVYEYLAARKGITVDHARELNNHVTKMAAELGLEYNMDKAIVANSFDAHRFAHLAATKNVGNAAEEGLFKAYFTEGKNIADTATLVQIGTNIGLAAADVKEVLATDAHAAEVEEDIAEASALGVQGVPFFVMDRKYAVSGAQSVEVFKQALDRAYTEWKAENHKNNLSVIDGDSCTLDGDCL